MKFLEAMEDDEEQLNYTKNQILSIPQENINLLKEVLLFIKEIIRNSTFNKMDLRVSF